MLFFNAKIIIMNMRLWICRLEEEKGPAHSRTFICSVHVVTTNDNFIALSECRSRVKDAEKSAALKMLAIVVKLYV